MPEHQMTEQLSDRSALESKALRAVALGLPEADALVQELKTSSCTPRRELEERAVRAVALGQADADTLVKQLSQSAS